MFKFLKEKIASWTKKISKEKTKEPEKKVPEKDLKEKVSESKKLIVPPEKKSFFGRIGDKLSKVKISEKEFKEYSEDLKMLLIENNVAYEVAEKIIQGLGSKVVGQEILKKEIESTIRDSLRDIIEDILIDPFDISEKIKERKTEKSEPYVILFVGINGTGKTTTIAKLASFLSKKGLSTVMAAGDTFRAASIEQIKEHGEKLGIPVIAQQYGADPASVGFDAISYAKKHHLDCVLVDTAGRMHTSKNLMKEIEKIAKICKPDLKIFLGESITGNDSVEQAKSFDASVGIDGIILSKADVDEKGGTALSLGYATKKPILFLGTGQGYESLEPFDKRKFSERLGL